MPCGWRRRNTFQDWRPKSGSDKFIRRNVNEFRTAAFQELGIGGPDTEEVPACKVATLQPCPEAGIASPVIAAVS